MPLFTYKCPKGHSEEILQIQNGIGEHPECSVCGEKMDRKISVPSPPKFNGSGFHATDYRNK